MQIGLSLVVFASLFRLALNQDKPSRERLWVAGLCAGALVLSAAACGDVVAGSLSGRAMLSTPKAVFRDCQVLLAVVAGTACCSSCWLVLPLDLEPGARATTAGITDAKNLFFIPYELF